MCFKINLEEYFEPHSGDKDKENPIINIAWVTFVHVNRSGVDRFLKMQTTALFKSPRGLDDDMWMKCLYGLCTEAVNHHSPAALGRMTVCLELAVFLEGRGRVRG